MNPISPILDPIPSPCSKGKANKQSKVQKFEVILTVEEKNELQEIIKYKGTNQSVQIAATRARALLDSSAGKKDREIAKSLQLSDREVKLLRKEFAVSKTQAIYKTRSIRAKEIISYQESLKNSEEKPAGNVILEKQKIVPLPKSVSGDYEVNLSQNDVNALELIIKIFEELDDISSKIVCLRAHVILELRKEKMLNTEFTKRIQNIYGFSGYQLTHDLVRRMKQSFPKKGFDIIFNHHINNAVTKKSNSINSEYIILTDKEKIALNQLIEINHPSCEIICLRAKVILKLDQKKISVGLARDIAKECASRHITYSVVQKIGENFSSQRFGLLFNYHRKNDDASNTTQYEQTNVTSEHLSPASSSEIIFETQTTTTVSEENDLIEDETTIEFENRMPFSYRRKRKSIVQEDSRTEDSFTVPTFPQNLLNSLTLEQSSLKMPRIADEIVLNEDWNSLITTESTSQTSDTFDAYDPKLLNQAFDNQELMDLFEEVGNQGSDRSEKKQTTPPQVQDLFLQESEPVITSSDFFDNLPAFENLDEAPIENLTTPMTVLSRNVLEINTTNAEEIIDVEQIHPAPPQVQAQPSLNSLLQTVRNTTPIPGLKELIDKLTPGSQQ